MENFNYIKKIIEKYGLGPATQRELPLFTLSCIALAYTKLIKKPLGFSYRAIAAIGKDGRFYTMFNEDYISDEMGKFIGKNYKKLDEKFFKVAIGIFNNIRSQFNQTKKIIFKNPEESLKIISEAYPLYMLSIGMYNCLWRYLGNEKDKRGFSSRQIKKISKERQAIAEFYPRAEKVIIKCVNLIDKKNKFDGDLLRYFTLDEMKTYLRRQKLSKEFLKILEKRRKKYFYLYTKKENEEKVFLDRKLIEKIEKRFFKIKEKIDLLKGFTVYRGVVRGAVYNINQRRKLPKKGFILVASSTHPKDIAVIKRSKAIVADEGGILSHAAIVSRELKKPCIIGTKIATKVLKDGDLVEVDANKGVVKILRKSK